VQGTHVVAGLDVAVPAQLLLVDVEVPLLDVHVVVGRGRRGRRAAHGRKGLRRVLGRAVVGVDGAVRVVGARARCTGDEDVGLDGRGEDAEEGVVDVLADQAIGRDQIVGGAGGRGEPDLTRPGARTM
jgi:hypothetical protein